MSRPSAAALLLLITLALALTAASPAGASRPRAGADLGVAALGDPPAKADAGASLRISFAVRNAGSRRAAASKIGFVLSLNTRRDAADVPLGTAKVAALRGRRSSRGQAKLRVPEYVAGGTYRVLACADLAGKVRERNERNNCRVARASMAVTGRPGGPSGPPVRPGNPELPPPPTGPGGGPGGSDPIPPDPAAIAPALPTTTAISTFDAASFLWSATTPVQRGVAPGTIDRDQVLVLRGRVLDRAGVPIEGVRVTVLTTPSWAGRKTRADGRYDLAVNGTGLTLEFEAAGFLTSSARSTRRGRTTTRVEDVVMVPSTAP